MLALCLIAFLVWKRPSPPSEPSADISADIAVQATSAEDSGKLQKALTAAAADDAETFAFCIDEDADYKDVVDDIINGYAYSWIRKANEKNDGDHQLSTNSKFFTYEEINAAAFVLEYK